jgi:hypothetical protein
MVKASLNFDVGPGMVDVLRDLARELGAIDVDVRSNKLHESPVVAPWIERLMSEMGLVIDHASAMELFRAKDARPESARSHSFRAALLRVSALALAGIEWCDRGGCPDVQPAA